MKTRQFAVTNYLESIARVNLESVQSLSSGMVIQPSVQQALQAAVANEHPFLKQIRFETVVAMTGQKIRIGSGSIAGRTPAGTTRAPTDNITATDTTYLLHPVQYDSFFSWQKLDNWAQSPQFAQYWRDQITKQIGIDIVTVGFNGLTAAATTDRAKNPLLQDVDRGWLQAIRDDAKSQAMGSEDKPIKVGDSEDCPYKNLDAVVKDAVNTLIKPEFRSELMVICHPSLLDGDNLKIINQTLNPEQRAIARVISTQDVLAGLKVVTVDQCPTGTILISALSNLAVYDQNGSARRTIYENPHRQGLEDLFSINRGYIVEDTRAVALIEHIQFV